jgi:type III secretion system low calcium response chaperone LcrH/SycD
MASDQLLSEKTVSEELATMLPGAETLPDEIANRFLKGGESIYKLEGLAKEDLEALYVLGSNFYEAQAYGEAREVFEQLCLLDDSDPKYWFALGGALQQVGRHEEALAAFSICQSIEPINPLPAYHAHECHLSLGDPSTASKALRLVLALTAGPDGDARLAARATTLLGELETLPKTTVV